MPGATSLRPMQDTLGRGRSPRPDAPRCSPDRRRDGGSPVGCLSGRASGSSSRKTCVRRGSLSSQPLAFAPRPDSDQSLPGLCRGGQEGRVDARLDLDRAGTLAPLPAEGARDAADPAIAPHRATAEASAAGEIPHQRRDQEAPCRRMPARHRAARLRDQRLAQTTLMVPQHSRVAASDARCPAAPACRC